MTRILIRTRKKQHVARLAASALLACSLACTSLAAFADDAPTQTVQTDESSQTTETSSSSQSTTSTSPAELHGLYADTAQTAHSNETAIVKTAEGACGLFANAGATIIANALTIQTQGDRGVAVSTSENGGAVSITNSQLSTSGSDAPLLFSTGIIEAEAITGEAAASSIAVVREEGSITVANSQLTSSYAGNEKSTIPSSAIALYRTSSIDATSSQSKAASFQASNSTLKSAIETGSFFYLTNTTASIVLFHNDLDFDTDAAKLLVAKGSDAATTITTRGDATTFGTTGKNGATVTLTALDQELSGDIEVDSISSLDYYLLDGSMWTGSASITSNAGTDLDSNIVVNIDATSGWIVTKNSTVSSLNIAKGGKLVDVNGKSVTIVDADGNKLVDGASNVKVSVTSEFSTTVKTADAGTLGGATIDRTAFDEEFGTSTTFGSNSNEQVTDAERAEELQTIIYEWFHNL